MKYFLQILLLVLLSTQIHFPQWTQQVSGTGADLNSVYFIDDYTGWTVGTGGVILHTTNGGTNWNLQTSGTGQELLSVYFVDNNTGWAVGLGGTILKTTNSGSSWISQSLALPYELHCVYFQSSNTGWVVGNAGKIYKTTDAGINWIEKNSGSNTILNTIYFPSSSIGFIGGQSGTVPTTILKTTNGGESWSNSNNGATGDAVKSIYFTSASDGFAVGGASPYGYINKTTDGGNSWTYQSNLGSFYHSTSFVNSTNGWVSGYLGEILKTTDGGLTWLNEGVITTANLWSIHFPSGNYGWCVGTGGTILKYDTTAITIVLASPIGGENWQASSSQNITWTSSDIENVKIEYTTNNGTSWLDIIASTPASTGSYSWTIPNTPTTQCKVRLIDTDNPAIGDSSNSFFAITSVPINPCPGEPTVTYLGKTYNTVKIGDQCWLRENLDVGTMIQGSQNQTNNSVIEKYCYNNDTVNCNIYGGLYQWNEAMQYVTTSGTQGICPIGWHLPTLAEFQTLKAAVNNDGNSLKAIGQAGTNTSGFSALLAGFRGTISDFHGLGEMTYFWSSTEYIVAIAANILLLNDDSIIHLYWEMNDFGFCIRCIKDETQTTSLQLTSPNGGENWQAGSQQNITWTSTNVTNVKIEYSLNNGTSWSTVTPSTQANTGVFTWTVVDTVATECKIKISDAANSSLFDISDNTFTISYATFQLTVSVFDGWNMVSAPGLHPTNQNVETWWPSLTGTVWGFDGIQYVAKAVTTPGEGYWMKNEGVEIYNYPAIQIVAHDSIEATSGWNMIGGYETSVASANLETSPPNQITGNIWGFNGVQYFPTLTLEPGYGYWVRVPSDCQIIIPDALSKGGEVVELFKQDWGRIVMADAAGISTTLYTIKGEVNLDEYSMPPLPPSGAFDIRFSSERIAEDINSSVQTINMVGVTYPLTIRVEGMDIRLMDETGKNLNVNLKSGEDIVISDATIQKLMVTTELIPDKYALEQNYPNPFNPNTTIKFAVTKESNVNLSIYNVLGEIVSTLVNEQMKPGFYEYDFNASNLASGVYLYRIQAGDFIETKKMVLMK